MRHQVCITRFVVVVAVLTVFMAGDAIAQSGVSWNEIATARGASTNVVVENTMQRFFMSLDAQEMLRTRHAYTLRDLPLSNGTVITLELEPAPSVFDQNTVFVTQGEQGEVRVPAPRLNCWRGRVENELNSSVFFCVSSLGILGTVTEPDGDRWFIASETSDPTSIVVSEEKELTRNWHSVFGCEAPDLPKEYARANPPRVLSNQLLEVELALETDSEFFMAAGSDLAKAQSYAMAILSLVSDIYEKELNIRVYVPWYNCWTLSPRDPYNAAGNPFTLRDKAIPYWTANRTSVTRDLYHVITSISYGGGGYGYLNQLCKAQYGMASSSVQVQHSYPTYAFTYDVYIVAHELGHNFNAQHTHSCFFGYPLDTCVVDDAIKGGCLPAGTTTKPNPGSIMSYCGGPNAAVGKGYQMRMTFLPQNIAIMRQSAESASCINPPPKPSIVLIAPTGSQAYPAKDPLRFEFLTTRVEWVKLDYSLDGGRSWVDSGIGYPTASGSALWMPPDTCTNSMMIRLRSIDDSTVADSTLLPFSVYQTAPKDLMASYEFAGDYTNSVCGGFDDARSMGVTVSFVPDRFGLKDSAVAFNGKGFLVAPSADLRSPELSVSLWCKPDSLAGKNTILGTNYGPGTNVFEIYNWGILGCSYYLNSGLWQFWSGGLQANQWSHIVFSYDGKTAKTWINNRLIKSDSKQGMLVPFVTSLYFGSRKGSEPFYGALDDIKIYRRALDSSSVAALFTEKRAADKVQLVSPANNEEHSEREVVFRWTTSVNATRYRLQVSRDAAFSAADAVIDTVVFADSCKVRLNNSDTEVYWRVQAQNAFGLSDVSSPRVVRFSATWVPASENEGPCVNVATTSEELLIDFSRCPDDKPQGTTDVVLTDLLGRVVVRSTCCTDGTAVMRVSLHGITRGVYVLQAGEFCLPVHVR